MKVSKAALRTTDYDAVPEGEQFVAVWIYGGDVWCDTYVKETIEHGLLVWNQDEDDFIDCPFIEPWQSEVGEAQIVSFIFKLEERLQ